MPIGDVCKHLTLIFEYVCGQRNTGQLHLGDLLSFVATCKDFSNRTKDTRLYWKCRHGFQTDLQPKMHALVGYSANHSGRTDPAVIQQCLKEILAFEKRHHPFGSKHSLVALWRKKLCLPAAQVTHESDSPTYHVCVCVCVRFLSIGCARTLSRLGSSV